MAKKREESDGGRKAAIDRARRKFNEKRQGEGMRSATMWTRFPKGTKGLAIIQLEGFWPEDALSGRHPLSLTRGEDGRISIKGLGINADGPGCGIEVNEPGRSGMGVPPGQDNPEVNARAERVGACGHDGSPSRHGATVMGDFPRSVPAEELEPRWESGIDPFAGLSREEWEAKHGEYKLIRYAELMRLDFPTEVFMRAGISNLTAFKGYLLELGYVDENFNRKDAREIDEAIRAHIARIDDIYMSPEKQRMLYGENDGKRFRSWIVPWGAILRIERLPGFIRECWGTKPNFPNLHG